MSEAKHTHGPWGVKFAGSMIRAENGDTIATVSEYGLQSESPDAQSANARLIAAVAAEREACADAESDAGRLALELECLLLSISDMPAVSRWWESANEALDLHRSRLDAIRARGAKGGEKC